MADVPFFSVVIPTYNRKKLVSEAIQSVFEQSFKSFEIIVVDDGSSDGTEKLLKDLCFNINYIKQKNSGVSIARNNGITHAKGKYICYLDSDDLWHKDKLAILYDICREYNLCDVIFHDFHKHNLMLAKPYSLSNSQMFPYIFDIYDKVNDEVWLANTGSSFELLLKGYPLYPSTVCIKKRIHDNYRWDPGVLKSEDFNLFLKLSLCSRFLYLDRSLTTIRVHQSNKSSDLLTKNRIVLDTIKMISMLYCNDKKRLLAKKHLVNLYFLNGVHHVKRGEYYRGFSLILRALLNFRFYANRITKIIHK